LIYGIISIILNYYVILLGTIDLVLALLNLTNYIIFTNCILSNILTTHENHEQSWDLGLFMRRVRRFSTPIRLSSIRFKVFQAKKRRKNRSHFFPFSFFTTCISGDDFSSTRNLFTAYSIDFVDVQSI